MLRPMECEAVIFCVLLLLQLAWEPQCVTSSGQPCVLFGVLLKGVGLFCCGALLLVCCFVFFYLTLCCQNTTFLTKKMQELET